MRRFLSWYLPVAIAAIASILFAWGFYTGLAGDPGTPIASSERAAPEPRRDPGRLDVLLLGDSLARGVGDVSGKGIGGHLVELLRERDVETASPVNIAVSGAKTDDLLDQLESPNVESLIRSADLIVISIGGNDLHGETRGSPPLNPEASMSGVLARVESAIRRVRERNPSSRIFVVGLYNPFVDQAESAPLSTAIQRWNAELRIRFANDPALDVVETSDVVERPGRLSLDRFHPNEESYAIIARRIVDTL